MNKELLQVIDVWGRSGARVALATVIYVQGSSPLPPGAAMAVNDRGEAAGSVSGGCVEAALYQELQQALEDGASRVLEYGVADDVAFGVGLSCGGTLHVYVQRLDLAAPGWQAFCEAVRSDAGVALLDIVDGKGKGARLVVSDTNHWGSAESSALDWMLVAEARAALQLNRTSLRQICVDGDQEGSTVFIESVAPAPRLFVLGATDHAGALARIGKFMGYRVSLCDARALFATRTRFPEVDDIVVAWPHEYLEQTEVGPRDAICVLTHDEKFDIPALLAALKTPAAYIGAMGSRRTHERRCRELLDAGVSEADLTRLSSPVGLDLGGRTPEETAIAVAAEIVALRHGKEGGRLSHRSGAIHC